MELVKLHAFSDNTQPMNEETLTNHSSPEPNKTPVPVAPVGEQDFSGSTLGSYHLTRKIAAGGMGVVYEAIQLKLDRKVALKVLTAELAARPEFLQRFEREAKAAAALNHPNVVQVHDFGEDNGWHYLIMEFVEGENLANHIEQKGKMPVDRALDLVEQAAQALNAAHEKSIIHRDIKPGNLMLTPGGRVKVSDLGLAKILTQESDMTVSGVGMGSPHYIAPEQADDARRVDHRADIYSLGLTLLFLLTGRRPFDGSTPFSIVLAHVNRPLPSGRELGTELPSPVETLIRRMSAKKPEDRYQNYTSLIADIKRVRRGQDITDGSATVTEPIVGGEDYAGAYSSKMMKARKDSSRVIAIAVVAGVLIFTGVGTFLFLHARNNSKDTAAAGGKARPELREEKGPQSADNRRRPPGDLQEAAFEPRSRPGDREGFGERPRRSPSDDHPGLFVPLNNVRNPIPDGPAEDMLIVAEKYARDNPENFRDIVARYEQLSEKTKGTPLGPKVDATLSQWQQRQSDAANKVVEEYKSRVGEMLKTQTHREVMDFVRTFPLQLRNDEIDERIVHEVAVPPPFEARGGERGERSERPPPRREP